MYLQLREHFPRWPKEFISLLEQEALFRKIPAEQTILREGAYVSALPIVLSGSVKVSRPSEKGEILLYYIEPGESCVMSFAACLSGDASTVQALTEAESELMLLPVEKLRTWIQAYPAFSEFLFELYHLRYQRILSVLDQFVFEGLEDRVWNYLVQQSQHQQDKMLKLTHHTIAKDLGTSREVISRVLKKLEKNGQLTLKRNQVELK